MNKPDKKRICWDDKFGMVEVDVKGDTMLNAPPIWKLHEQVGMNRVIEGIGKDAEIVVNSKGGKQSKSPMAMHLVDAGFLDGWFNTSLESDAFEKDDFIGLISLYMMSLDEYRTYLLQACFALHCEENNRLDKDDHENMVLVEIAKVLQEGAEKYEPNNWRLIPQEEHLNHALIHYLAYTMGDTQDNHYGHCLCRLMMAYATEKSERFEYSRYVAK